MRVLGIDPGLTRCGVGVVEGSIGRPLSLVDVGVVRTGADEPIEQRLCQIEAGLERWLDATRPDAVAVERVFSQHNVKTVMGTAQASGIALLVAARRGLPVALHTPSEVKAAVTGSGRADKAQVGAMVARLLRLTEVPRPADSADALALAICHIWRGGASAKIEAALAAQAAGKGTTHDRFRQWPRRRGRAHLRGARGRWCRSRPPVHSGHHRGTPGRVAGDAAHEHGGARGLADPVRLRRRRREADVRARADGEWRGTQARAGDAGGAPSGGTSPSRELRRREDPDDGPRDRPEGCPADHPGAARPDRIAAPDLSPGGARPQVGLGLAEPGAGGSRRTRLVLDEKPTAPSPR